MKAHRTDVVSLVFGLIFLAIVGLWLTGRSVGLDAAALGWTLVIALIGLGLVGIAAAVAASFRSDRTPEPDEPDPMLSPDRD